ncbi:MAG: hypothetical protein VCE43_24215 [Myxococcota bacterium]
MRQIRVAPLIDAPIIPTDGQLPDAEHHDNVNGPCLIRVPSWLPRPLGAYYLYFADHKGSSIKLAYADRLTGPWSIYEPGALHLSQTPFLQHPPAIPDSVDRELLGVPRAPGVPSPLDDCTIPHIASPDVIADESSRTVRLYYHGLDAFASQISRVAVSTDGLQFEARTEIVSPSYLRMFPHAGSWYGIAMPGGLFRSDSGIDDFEAGPTLFGPDMRHAGLWKRNDTLWVFWTRVGDAPERILLSTIDLRGDWTRWEESEPVEVYRPMQGWEGAGEPIEPSVRSSVDHAVNQLRDPFILVDGDDVYMVYAVAGESGLGIARLEVSE